MDPHHPVRGWNVLARKRIASGEEEKILLGFRARLERKREERIRPGRDDKILTSWNALAISGYARAARWGGGRPYARRAEEIWEFLRANLLRSDGTPTHRWRNGKRDDVHLLEDYAGLLQALLDLHQATLQVSYLKDALKLASVMLKTFQDDEGGGLWSGTDPSLIARMKDDYDGAEPSGNAVAALALVELGRLTDDPSWTEEGRRILDWLGERMKRIPQAVPHALLALQRISEPPGRLVLAGPDWESLPEGAARVYRPDLLLTRATEDHPSEFVRGLQAVEKKGAAYLCEGGSCQLPVREAGELVKRLQVRAVRAGR